ncbi:hypothetical protein ACFQ64_16410 [Streptomyces sp. NPDC056460]|uniref:hypothetical protein n=1 Tax=Streptomyces sp. NPDC056460 TaxID=3345825 RepID=UPI00368313D5
MHFGAVGIAPVPDELDLLDHGSIAAGSSACRARKKQKSKNRGQLSEGPDEKATHSAI